MDPIDYNLPQMPQSDFNDKPRLRFNKRGMLLVAVFLFPLLAGGMYMAFTWTHDLWISNEPPKAQGALLFPKTEKRIDKDYIMPNQEKNRYDVLILGVRGKDDPDGGSLADAIMLFSIDKTTNQSTLVSIPRDLYVQFDDKHSDKLNAAYVYLGLKGTERLVSKITGVYVDNSIVFDFSSFKKIVDDLGGIDIFLEHPFEETTQWGYVFQLPAGLNHLDGENALYYVRSRYSTSDFDRARRQQQVMFAIKNKIVQLDLMSNPTRALSLISTLKRHIHTDIDILDIRNLIALGQQVDQGKIQRHVISTIDYLYESRAASGAYVLLPQGDNFERLKLFFKTVLAGGAQS